MTHPFPQVLAYTYITVKFQLRSSINVRLTESSVYNRLCIEMSPKWGFGVILGVGAKMFAGKVHPSSELRVFRHLLCPDLTRRVVCENLGKFGGLQLPYQKSQENIAAGRHPFRPSATTWKNRNHSAM